jgi:hypothetical protein
MRYEARATVFDMLDQVCASVYVVETTDTPGVTSRVVLNRSVTIPGTGELDPSHWATDALVALLETL